jgi:hypothetical protein
MHACVAGNRRVHVKPQPFGVDRIVRTFACEREYVRGTLLLPPPAPVVHTVGSDGGVVAVRSSGVGALAARAADGSVFCPDRGVVLECAGPWVSDGDVDRCSPSH